MVKAPRTLAACCTAFAISRWGGRSSAAGDQVEVLDAELGGETLGQMV